MHSALFFAFGATDPHFVRLCCGAEGTPYIFPADSVPTIPGCEILTRQLNVLDLCLVLDTTESMGPYLDQARRIITQLGFEVNRQFHALKLIGDSDEATCRIAVSPYSKVPHVHIRGVR